MKFAMAAVIAALASTSAYAQVNIGTQAPEASLPFVVTQVTTFNQPWRIAFLPDGRMLITEKPGALWLVTQAGAKTQVANAPAVLAAGLQGGMLGVFLSPHYARDRFRPISPMPSRATAAFSSLALAPRAVAAHPPARPASKTSR